MARGIKTGGRQKGTPNKRTVAKRAAVEAAAARGMLPLDYMLRVMRSSRLDVGTRLEAAKAAAPYCHPKLSQIELGNAGGRVFTVQLLAEDSGVL